MPAEREVGVDPVLDRGEAELLEAPDRRLGERLVAEVREWRAPPQRERGAELLGRVGRVSGRECAASLLDEALEPMEVERIGLDPRLVAAGSGHEDIGRQHAAEAGDERRECIGGALRRVVTPQLVDQPVTSDDLVRAQQQECQQPALPGTAERERLVVEPGFERAEQAELERSLSRHPPVIRSSSPAQILPPRKQGGKPEGSETCIRS